MDMYIGADWSATFAACAVGRGDEDARNVGNASRSLESVREMFARAGVSNDDRVHVVIEAGDEGWVRLFHAAGAVAHVVDPKQMRRFAESLGSSGAKDDKRDARTLVDLGRSPRHLPEEWASPSPVQQRLLMLSAAHDRLTGELGREQQRIRGELRQHMPLVDEVITNLRSRWAQRLLRLVPTAWHATQLTKPDFDRQMALPDTKRETVWSAVSSTECFSMDEGTAETHAFVLAQHLDVLALLDQQLREVDRQMDELTAPLENRALLETIAGIGLQQGVVLLVEGFDSPPTHRDQVATRMGAAPVFVGSSKTPKGQPKGSARMRRAASPRAKRAVYLMGRLAAGHLAWAKAMYADARSRGQTAAHAYRRISRSLMRILTAMLRDKVPYDDARYLATLKAKGVPWALSL